MVLIRTDSSTTIVRATSSCGVSAVPKQKPGVDYGIVEGWRGNEDEDVNIDSDEIDSGSEELPGAAEIFRGQSVPGGGSSTQSPNSSGMRGKTESTASAARDEDHARSNDQGVSPNIAVEDNGLQRHPRKEQAGRFDDGRASRGVNEGLRVARSALDSPAKRLDARRFRRDLNVKLDSAPARTKTVLPDAGRIRGSLRSDEKEGKKLAKEKELAGGVANKFSPTLAHNSATSKKRTSIVAGASNGKGKRTSRDEISQPDEFLPRRNEKVRVLSSEEQFRKDNSKKRRFNDVDDAQAAARKSSLRGRTEVFKQSENRMRRESFGHKDTESSAKRKLARKDAVFYQKGTESSAKRKLSTEDAGFYRKPTSVPETPAKRGLEKLGKSPVSLSPKVARQDQSFEKRSQRPRQANGNSQKPSAEGEDPVDCPSDDGPKKPDPGASKETVQLYVLAKLLERRSIREKEKQKEKGLQTEDKSSAPPQSSDVPDVAATTPLQKAGEEVSGKLVDRKHARSPDRAHGAGKSQQQKAGSFERQKSIAQSEEGGSLSMRCRPTESGEKGTEDAARCTAMPMGILVKGTSRDSEDKSQDPINLGVDRRKASQEVSGSELKVAGVGDIEVDQSERKNGKRKQRSDVNMKNNGRLSQSGDVGQIISEIKESTEGSVLEVDQHARVDKQTSPDGKVKSSLSLQGNNTRSPSLRRSGNIWHPKTPLSQGMIVTSPGVEDTMCVASPRSSNDVDPKVATVSSDVPPEEAFLRERHAVSDTDLEEGEIGSSDADGKQVAPKSAEPVLLKEADGEKRLGFCENDRIHESRKSVIELGVRDHEPNRSNIQRFDKSGDEAETIDSIGSIALAKGVAYGKPRTSDMSEVDGLAGPRVSSVAVEEQSEPVASVREDEPKNTDHSRHVTSLENDSNDRNIVHELCVPEDSPTNNRPSIGRDPGDELHTASDPQAANDVAGEDGSGTEVRGGSDYHHSYCQSCGEGGELICCDGSGCKVTYHLECTDHPKLREVPSKDWYCPTCAHARLSCGIRAVSKSVESIWEVRKRAENSDHLGLLPKNIPASDLHSGKDPRMKKRLGEGAGGNLPKNTGTVDDDCNAPVTVSVGGEEGIPPISEATPAPQGVTEEQTILRSTSSVARGLKLMDDSGDKEYFVKWRGIAHAYNSWVGETELAKLSPKGLPSFKRKLAEGKVAKWNPDWAEPQRLVDKRTCIPSQQPGGGKGRACLGMHDQIEWFVKWKGLGYEHCTWEPANSVVLSDPKVKHLEMMYERWSEAAKQRNHPKRVEEVGKLRQGSFKQLHSQPEWIQFGKLLPYQLDRLNQLRQRWHNHQNTIRMDRDDKEKSSTTVTFLLSLIEEYGVYRLILVVVPVFEIQCWEAEFSEYAPQVNTVVYIGNKEARGVIQRTELNRSNTPMKVQVVLTTCEVAFSDFDYLRKMNWEVVVIDDNTSQSKITKSHRAFLQFDAAFWLLFINELSKYNVEELEEILVLFHPKNSSSTSNIRKQLTELNESGQLQYLKDQLSEHIVKDIGPDYSSGLNLTECWVGTNMTSLQVELYCNTLVKHYNLLLGRSRADPDSTSLHDLAMQLRLCCQHPYLVEPVPLGCDKPSFPPSEELINAGVKASEKWQLINAMLSVLHEQHQRVVILSQKDKLLFFLEDYLRLKYGPESYELVDIKSSASVKNSAVQKFNTKDSTRSFFLLRTGASGFSLKLKDKDVVIIHDSDLNPANDMEYLRKVLHRVDGELKVFRLFQRLTLEEGSRVYDHQNKFAPDSKTLSVKNLQKLLRWKVQHLLELDSSSSVEIDVSKEKQEENLKEKAACDMERVKNILQGKIEVESEAGVDEVWNGDVGDPDKEFWFSTLKDRHAKLKDDEEQSNPGKGLRQRKRVLYSEDALAQAPYSIPEGEGPRAKKRKPHLGESSSIPITQDKPVQSVLQPTSSTAQRTRSEPVVKLNASESEQNSGEKISEPVGGAGVDNLRMGESSSKALNLSNKDKEELGKRGPAEVGKGNKHPKLGTGSNVSAPTPQVDTAKRLRTEQKQQLLKMEPELSRIAGILKVTDTVSAHSQQLLFHVMTNFRMPKEPRELVVMVEISLCLIASAHFGEALQHVGAVSHVGEELSLDLKNQDFGSVYARLEGMCKSYVNIPSAQQGPSHKETSLDKAVDGDVSTQADREPSAGLRPHSEGSDRSAATKSNMRSSSGQQACSHQEDSSEKCAVIVDKPDMGAIAKEDPPRTELEKSCQPAQAGTDEINSFQDVDPTSQAQGTAEAHDPEPAAGDGQSERQPKAISPEIIQPPLLQTIEAIRSQLKSDRDQLLHSWLAKQKLEVQEFNASCARGKAARQKSFEQQNAKILASSLRMERREEMLKQSRDVFASTRKICERQDEDRRQAMNSTQREIRDKINALYAMLQQQVTSGKVPDLLSEAKSMGLTFSIQSQTPKLSEHGPTHSKQGHLKAIPQDQQTADVPPSVPGQTMDKLLRPSTQTTQIQPHPQNETQPLAQEGSPVPPSNSPSQSQPQLQAPAVSSSQNTTISQTVSQTVSVQTSPNADQGLSTFQERVAPQLSGSQPLAQTSQPQSLQTNIRTNERSHPSRSHTDILISAHTSDGIESIPAISTHGLERAHSAAEQGSVQPSIAEQVRVSEATIPSISRQPLVSQALQSSTSLQARGSQFPSNLQPSSTQIMDTPTSLQARISPSVQAAMTPLPRVPTATVTLPPQVSPTVDAPSSLHSRLSLSHRPQPRTRLPTSLYQSATTPSRMQTQPQSIGGLVYPISSASAPSQPRSNVHPQNTHLGAHPSQAVPLPDPLAHLESRLKREQEREKQLYGEETAQIKAQYDIEAAELRRKYEELLQERSRKFEQSNTALNIKLLKVDRNRQLAEALKLRSSLDVSVPPQPPKPRQISGHNTEIASGSGQAGRLSGLPAGRGNLHSSQSNAVRNFPRSLGRGFPGAAASSGSDHLTSTESGVSMAQGFNRGSPIASWQSSRPNNNRNLSPAGFTSGGPLSSTPPSFIPTPLESPSSAGFVSFPDSFQAPSLPSSSGQVAVPTERVLYEPLASISPSMQQGRPWNSLSDGSENITPSSSSTRGERLFSQHSNSELDGCFSPSTAPAIGITTAVSSQVVTEAVVVSVSPVLSPVTEQLRNTELAGNEFMQGRLGNLGSGPLFADEGNDVSMPLLNENQISSHVETMLRGGALAQGPLGGPGAPTLGHVGVGSSQPPTNELNHNPPPPSIPIICLSDDDD